MRNCFILNVQPFITNVYTIIINIDISFNHKTLPYYSIIIITMTNEITTIPVHPRDQPSSCQPAASVPSDCPSPGACA